MLKSLALCLVFGSLVGCATKSEYIEQEDYGKNSKADGAAYAADAMYIRPLMKSRADWKPQPFYYQECDAVGGRAYYSKTSYDCNDGP